MRDETADAAFKARCEEFLRQRPDDDAALTRLWDLCHESGEHDRAIAALGRAIAADPKSARFRYLLGCTLEDAGRNGEAAAAYRQALQLDPGFARAHNNLGCLLEIAGDTAGALQCYEAAARADPGLATALQNRDNLAGDGFRPVHRQQHHRVSRREHQSERRGPQVMQSAGEARMLVLNVRGGARLCVPDSLDRMSSYILLEQEDWFEDEIRFVRRWLRPGMQAVDVGANLGVYTLAMARAIGQGGRVWAYEPTPDTADTLQCNLELNGAANVAVQRAAVSDKEGSIAFATGVHPETNAVAAVGVAAEGVIECAAVTLDRIAREQDWSAVDFVKIDVEGHECEAIRGGAKFFASASPLLMFEVRDSDKVKMDAIDLVMAMGYDVYRLLPGPLMLVPFDRFGQIDQYLLNVFACKRDRAGRLAADGLLAASNPAESAAPQKDAWARYLRTAPYARELAAGWPAKAGFFSSADRRTYAEGLNAFALSRDGARDPAERLAWLSRAFQCVAEALDARATVGRRISYARLAAELGWRVAAVETLERNIDQLLAGEPQVLTEPFLAPSLRYENLGTGADAPGWLKCACLEEFERQRAFSSIYMQTHSLDLIGMMGDLPFRSAEMERRRQLVRMRHGMQDGPEPAAVLRERTEENLNPQFWTGSA
jgi:FkbM family methyltransferase